MRVMLCCEYPNARQQLEKRLSECGIESTACDADAILAFTAKSGMPLLKDIAARALERGAGLVVLTAPEDIACAESALCGCGATVLSYEVPFTAVVTALQAAAKTGERLNAVRGELEKLKQRYDDERIINRAKLLLIEHCGMTECEAHRYIEKSAMNMRAPRRKVALDIIEKYGK